ncbi:MAG: hypothetical protein V4794_01800 [Pseudomonadota bacterium]
MGPTAAAAQAWHGPLHLAMWLWSITWCAKWRALSSASAQVGADGEDWSSERSEPALASARGVHRRALEHAGGSS